MPPSANGRRTLYFPPYEYWSPSFKFRSPLMWRLPHVAVGNYSYTFSGNILSVHVAKGRPDFSWSVGGRAIWAWGREGFMLHCIGLDLANRNGFRTFRRHRLLVICLGRECGQVTGCEFDDIDFHTQLLTMLDRLRNDRFRLNNDHFQLRSSYFRKGHALT